MRKAEAEKLESIKMLRRFGVRPGSTVYTTCDHVSRSGMMRRISCYSVTGGRVQNITGYVANVVGYSRDMQKGGMRVGGCGMDMGFHVVYTLGRIMFPKGGPLAKSTRHAFDATDHETDGGYLLRHEWL